MACLADLHASSAVGAPHPADARALTIPASSTASIETALGRAHAPGASQTPSRLTRIPGDHPLTGLPSGREAGSLPAADARVGDVARIAEVCSAPATPEAGVSAAQGDAVTSDLQPAPTPAPPRTA